MTAFLENYRGCFYFETFFNEVISLSLSESKYSLPVFVIAISSFSSFGCSHFSGVATADVF